MTTHLLLACLTFFGCAAKSPHTSVANTLYVIGTVHDGHAESASYSADVLRDVLRTIAPDIVLAEIPPDRLGQALSSFTETGVIDEPRVSRFVEHTDVLFPLRAEREFDIVGVAGWTKSMADFRSAAMKRLSEDPTRADDWQAVQAGFDAMAQAIGERRHDPIFIHSPAYDAITESGLAPYATRFANDLGSGDWQTINQAHYELIERALDREIGKGVTLVLMFGASHKYWFIDKLRQRPDVHLADVSAVFRARQLPDDDRLDR